MKQNTSHSVELNRRDFIKRSAALAAGAGLLGTLGCKLSTDVDLSVGNPLFKISLAQWSLHRSFFEKKLDPLDFAKVAKTEFDIEGIEYVNQFFKDKAKDSAYLAELNKRANDNGVTQLIIMVDGEGNLGDTDAAARKKAVENHYKWVDAAKTLGCHSIRVNAAGNGTREEVAAAVVEGLGSLADYGSKADINVIVENHGGYSSDGSWLSGVMQQINKPNCGTLPDFGNFCVEYQKDADGNRTCANMYDRYKGTAELMPFAKAVSAKSHDFDASGNETNTDYMKIMKIVLAAGYSGWVGVEYEGGKDDEYTGIRKTRDLLLKVREALSA